MVDHTPVRKKGKTRALRASQVHPGQKCTQCTLCNENANSYVHSVNWRPSEVSLLHQLAPDVAGTDCICRACGEDVKRSFQSSEYTPRWIKKRQCTTVLKVCAIQDCVTDTKSVKVTTIGTIEELQKLLNCDVININFDDGIPLCSIHYNEFYRHIDLAAPCASCGVLPGGGKKFFRHPPNSTLVNRLLENIDFPVNDCDVICKSCYDFHRFLISDTKTSSSDEHLLITIEDLSKQVSLLPTQNEAEITLWALNKTALNVAAEIKCNHALLMTSVYNEFLQTINNCY